MSNLQSNLPIDGWIPANETWDYASATTITVPSGAASKYQKGDKIKITNSTVKYFSIITVADTLLTVTGGTDYTVANATISANFYSHQENPMGFPDWFNFNPTISWTAGTAPSGSPAKYQYFKISGRTCTMNIFNYGYTAGATVTDAAIPLPVVVLSGGYASGYGQITVDSTPNSTTCWVGDTNCNLKCTTKSADRLQVMVTYPI